MSAAILSPLPGAQYLRLQRSRGHQLGNQHDASFGFCTGFPEVIKPHDVWVL